MVSMRGSSSSSAMPCTPRRTSRLDRSGGFARRQATQWRALARLLPHTDVFHFVFGLTLVPQSLQFPLLRLLRKKSVMHYLGSDIRGKTPAELAYGKKAGAEIVGSYDAIRWVPEAEVIPPGIDLSRFTPAPPSDRARPLILHAPSSRRRKGTEHVIAAVEGLDADLEIVEGLHHDEAFERFRHADIVVDQLNAGWYGLFAIECMALGKPVVTFLHDDAVRRTEERVRHDCARSSPPPPRRLRERAAPARRGREPPKEPTEPRHVRTSSSSTTRSGSPTASSTSTLDSDGALRPAEAARQALRDLRPRRPRLADPRRPAPAALHALPLDVRLREDRDPDRPGHGARDRAPVRDLVGVLPLLLRRRRRRRPPPRAAHVVLVHDDDGDARSRRAPRVRGPDRGAGCSGTPTPQTSSARAPSRSGRR